MADLASVGGVDPLGERFGRAPQSRDPRKEKDPAPDAEAARTDTCAVARGAEVAFGVLRERVLHATSERLRLSLPRSPFPLGRTAPTSAQQAVLWIHQDQRTALHGLAADECDLRADFARGLDDAESLLREVGQCDESTQRWFASVRAAALPAD